MRDHAAIEELIALQSLDGLDPSDERQLAAQRSDHGAGCVECLRLESGYGEVAGRLAFGLEPAEIREGYEDELVAIARGGGVPSRSAGAPGAGPPRSLERERDRRRFATPMRALAGVVAAVLIVAAGVGGYLLAPREDTTAQALEQLLKEPGAATLSLSGSANGAMNVVYAPGNPHAFVVGSGLDEPPTGKAYELWLFHGQTPASAGCFATEDGNVLHEVSGDPSGANAVAVTVDSDACPSAPTTQPVMSAEV